MLESVAEWLVTALVGYTALGVIFAIPFAFRGVDMIDPAARNGTWGFRVLIFPGSVALWPILLRRVASGKAPPIERNSHRERAQLKKES